MCAQGRSEYFANGHHIDHVLASITHEGGLVAGSPTRDYTDLPLTEDPTYGTTRGFSVFASKSE